MTTINRAFLTTLRADIDAALKAVGEKHGVILNSGNASYTVSTATIKLNVSTISEDGTVITKEAHDYLRYAGVGNNLQKEWLGEEFKTEDGEVYKVVGYRPRSKKYPVLAEKVSTGVVFKFQPRLVSIAFSK